MDTIANKTGIYTNCDECGKELYQTQTQYNRAKHHFCSNECSTSFRVKNSKEIRICEHCEVAFDVKKGDPKRFCSVKCQNEWQKLQTGELNSNYNRTSCNCDNCNETLNIISSEYKRNTYNFCNEECRKNWYATIWSQSEEWKNESRLRAVKLLKNNKATTNTKPQLIINSILEDLNIKYENEKNCKYYSLDNYLIDYNLMIEVMGDYWHASPLKYDTVKQSQQLKVIPRDKAKHTYVKNKYNIEILYLWEHDIIKNIDMCKKLILEYVKNKGILQNYHSFNFNISKNQINLNDIIIVPHQDRIANKINKTIDIVS